MSLSVNMNENQMLHKQVFLSGGMQILKFKDKMLQKQEFIRAGYFTSSGKGSKISSQSILIGVFVT